MINLGFIAPRCTTSSVHKKGRNNKKQRKHRKKRKTHDESFNSLCESFNLDARCFLPCSQCSQTSTKCIFRLNVGSPQIPSVLAFKTLKIAAHVSYTVCQTVCLSVSCFCARQRSYTVWHTVCPNRVTNRVCFWNFSRIVAVTRFCQTV